MLALSGHSSRILAAQNVRLRSRQVRKAAFAAGRGERMALRIPRVSLRVEAADENDLGEVHGETLGLGLMLLLALDMMLGGDQGSGVMPGLMRYVFCAAAALMLLCGAVLDKRVHAVFRTYKPVVVAMVLFVPGAVCGIVGGHVDPSIRTVFQLIGGICNGLSMGLLVFLWGISFGRLGLRDITLNSVLVVVGGIGASTDVSASFKMNVNLSVSSQARPVSTFSPLRYVSPSSVPDAAYVFVYVTALVSPAAILPSAPTASAVKPVRGVSLTL